MKYISLSGFSIKEASAYIGCRIEIRSKGKLNGLQGVIKRHMFKDIWDIELDNAYAGTQFKSVCQRNLMVIE